MGPRSSKRPPSSFEDAADCARACALCAWEKKAFDLVALDLRELFYVDCFVLATISNKLQMRALLQEMGRMAKRHGLPSRTEGGTSGGWALVDLGYVVVHLFLPEQRRYYDLELLWGDAPRLDVGLPTAES